MNGWYRRCAYLLLVDGVMHEHEVGVVEDVVSSGRGLALPSRTGLGHLKLDGRGDATAAALGL